MDELDITAQWTIPKCTLNNLMERPTVSEAQFPSGLDRILQKCERLSIKAQDLLSTNGLLFVH
ncbi:hypothetical protein D918_02261 [Trichuris suis]|nr:hypothetical protein D918_02261 [Trichuris suis]